MTAVAVQCRPAMGSCMVGIRLNRSCALMVPDFSDPGEYPEVGVGIFRGPKVFASAKSLYNFGIANVLVL